MSIRFRQYDQNSRPLDTTIFNRYGNVIARGLDGDYGYIIYDSLLSAPIALQDTTNNAYQIEGRQPYQPAIGNQSNTIRIYNGITSLVNSLRGNRRIRGVATISDIRNISGEITFLDREDATLMISRLDEIKRADNTYMRVISVPEIRPEPVPEQVPEPEIQEHDPFLKQTLENLIRQIYGLPVETPEVVIMNNFRKRFITYPEAIENLQRCQILKYLIEPLLQSYVSPNGRTRVISLFDKNGAIYLVKAIPDLTNNQILAPE